MKSENHVAIAGCGGSMEVSSAIYKSKTMQQPQVEADTTNTSDTK